MHRLCVYINKIWLGMVLNEKSNMCTHAEWKFIKKITVAKKRRRPWHDPTEFIPQVLCSLTTSMMPRLSCRSSAFPFLLPVSQLYRSNTCITIIGNAAVPKNQKRYWARASKFLDKLVEMPRQYVQKIMTLIFIWKVICKVD